MSDKKPRFQHFRQNLRKNAEHVVSFFVGAFIGWLLIDALESLFQIEQATREIEVAQITNTPPTATGTLNTASTTGSLPITFWTSIVKGTSEVEIKKWGELLISLLAGCFLSLLTYWITTVKERTTHNYRALSGAVRNFLTFTKDSHQTSDSGSVEDRFGEFVTAFDSEEEPFSSFSKAAFTEDLRLFSLLKKSHDADVDAETYQDQIRIASVLCAHGRKRFWATCTDPTLVFQRENAYYQHALEAASDDYRRTNRVNRQQQDEVPYLCRIFLGPKENLDYSLELYALDFLDMYRQHVLWAEQPDLEPVKFLFGNASKLITDAGGRIDDLEDFMIVDDSFVYGRKGEFTRHGPHLRTLTKRSELDRYAETFRNLYRKAQNVFQILDGKIIEATGRRQDDLKNLKSLCDYIKRKAGNRDLYQARFPDKKQRHGTGFFNRVCHLIETSGGDVIAVDVADKKVSFFYRAWLNHESYLEFQKACAKAVKSGKKARRVFILRNKLDPSHAAEIVTFLSTFLRDGMDIAFLSESEAKLQFENQPYSFDFELDFLLGGIPREFSCANSIVAADEGNFKGQARSTGFGFELFGNEPFVEEMLEWERNLVDLEGIFRKVQWFTKLWSAVPPARQSNSIKTADAKAVQREAESLKDELLKLN